MRCKFCSAESPSVTFPGNGDDLQKRENPCRGKGSGVDRRQLATGVKVEAAGIECEDAIPQCLASQQLTTSGPAVSAPCLHGNVVNCQFSAVRDTTLTRLIELWPFLRETTRANIYALCVDDVLLANE
jgi:hypothetical protein